MTEDNWRRLDSKTDVEIAADAASDPDSAPMQTPEQLAKMRRVSLVKHVRQKLGMSRENFAASYGIPLEALNAWERHEAKPTLVEEAYLRLILREPERAKPTAPVAAK
jgi:putative transcriptional regulator